MENQNKLMKALKDISDKYWTEQGSPVLLSILPQMLKSDIPDYRAVLRPRTLKAFISETQETAGYQLVEHPTQRARLGIAPATANYKYPLGSPPPETIPSKSNQGVTLAFFRALATLPDAELDKVVIPASVLVKLLK